MIMLLLASCINDTLQYRRVLLSGTLISEEDNIIYLSAHHAWYEDDLLRHPAAQFATSESMPGDFSWSIDVPFSETTADGLLIYAWQDTDGDGIFCGLDGDVEYSDMYALSEEPPFSMEISLTPQFPCEAPETLYALIEE